MFEASPINQSFFSKNIMELARQEFGTDYNDDYGNFEEEEKEMGEDFGVKNSSEEEDYDYEREESGSGALF